MSWNNCRKCMFSSRTNFTSALLKVLVTLKLLHGGRTGAKGSTLEDIAMHMIKHFSLDGDIKSQVLASLKFGVKMHFIQKRKDKFALIVPASSIHLAPCKFKNEEIERIQCLYPVAWQSNACADSSCGGDDSCCGKRKRSNLPGVCCQQDNSNESTCGSCKPKPQRSTMSCGQPNCSQMSKKNSCDKCFPPPRKRRKCQMRPMAAPCSRKQKHSTKSMYDNYCQLCGGDDDEDDDDRPEAYSNCSCCQ